MERLIMHKLLDWKNSPYRKPLILKGVRQVGKTWVLKEFGKRYYENVAYFNFDENEEYKQFFETTKDVDRILQNLMLASGENIAPEKTLIIFDEVQDCPKVINSMKYFCENAPAVSYCLCGFFAWDHFGETLLISSWESQFHADRSYDFYRIFICQRG